LRRKIKRLFATSQRQRKFRNLRNIKTTLILFDTSNYEDARFIINQLKTAGKAITTVAYRPANDERNFTDRVHYVVSESDISALGEETMTMLTQMLAERTFDVVIDLTLTENLLMQYVLVNANAGLKTGLYASRPPLHDMVVAFTDDGNNPPFTVKSLGMSMLHYLSTISAR
jgi:hypothetical protein